MTQVFNFPKGKWLVRYMEIPKDRVDIRGSGWEQRGHTICSLRTETPVLGTRHEHGTCKGCSGELHHPGMQQGPEKVTSHLLNKSVAKLHPEPEGTPGIQFHICENVCCLHPRIATQLDGNIPEFSASNRKSNVSPIFISWQLTSYFFSCLDSWSMYFFYVK